jgi:hypothetical protein
MRPRVGGAVEVGSCTKGSGGFGEPAIVLF